MRKKSLIRQAPSAQELSQKIWYAMELHFGDRRTDRATAIEALEGVLWTLRDDEHLDALTLPRPSTATH
jgi:hypothetical protein